jgi:cyclopropane fatty-acyl-phospholipid synthase-like methyltransferase
MNENSITAFERNKDPILQVLKEVIQDESLRVIEVGAGSGQHAVYFAKHFKNVVWTTTEVATQLESLSKVMARAKLPNLRGPLNFEVGVDQFPRYTYDIVFTANTFHIMSWKQCKNLMKILGNRLREGAQVIIYGPFNYDGKFTSESNAEFDRQLKETSPERGIRAFLDVNNNMLKNGFTLYKDFEMPANNRMLVYTRLVFVS